MSTQVETLNVAQRPLLLLCMGEKYADDQLKAFTKVFGKLPLDKGGELANIDKIIDVEATYYTERDVGTVKIAAPQESGIESKHGIGLWAAGKNNQPKDQLVQKSDIGMPNVSKFLERLAEAAKTGRPVIALMSKEAFEEHIAIDGKNLMGKLVKMALAPEKPLANVFTVVVAQGPTTATSMEGRCIDVCVIPGRQDFKRASMLPLIDGQLQSVVPAEQKNISVFERAAQLVAGQVNEGVFVDKLSAAGMVGRKS